MSESTTYAQVLRRLRLRAAGGNYAQVKKYIKEARLETGHFTGQAWSRGLKLPHARGRPLSEILTEDSTCQSFWLKQRLYAANLKPRHCE